jgi:trans-aconitate methyltransferase
VLARTDQDVAFWEEVCRAAGGPVLELACGAGRVTMPLAAAGIDVVGLDVDPAMLSAMPRRTLSPPLLLAADMARFALARRFAAVIIPYNSFQLLTEAREADACLRLVAEHLAPAGCLALEVTDFQAGAVHAEVAEEVVATGSFDGAPLALQGALTHDFGRRISWYRRRFVSPTWEAEDVVVLRSYSRPELETLLGGAGFRAERWWSEQATTRVVAYRTS